MSSIVDGERSVAYDGRVLVAWFVLGAAVPVAALVGASVSMGDLFVLRSLPLVLLLGIYGALPLAVLAWLLAISVPLVRGRIRWGLISALVVVVAIAMDWSISAG